MLALTLCTLVLLLSSLTLASLDDVWLCDAGKTRIKCCGSDAEMTTLKEQHNCAKSIEKCRASVKDKKHKWYGKCNNESWNDPNKLYELRCTPSIDRKPVQGAREFNCCGKNWEIPSYDGTCTIVGDSHNTECPSGMDTCKIDMTTWYRFTCGDKGATCCSPITRENRYKIGDDHCKYNGKQDCTDKDRKCDRNGSIDAN